MTDELLAPPSTAAFASSPTPPPPPPGSDGWAGAATAIHALRQIPRPILISLTPRGHRAIAIDPRTNVYVWDVPLTEFPADPGSVVIGTYPIEGDAPGLAGTQLGIDPLLWMIGLNAFPGTLATWLREGDKFRLRWWPEFERFPHTPDQARLIKTVAKGMMTVDKLATLARVSRGDAACVINALSLMGALRRLESPKGAPALPPVTAEYDAPDRARGRHVRRGG
jgi:hypothetical protein